jgi:hypothetical protein
MSCGAQSASYIKFAPTGRFRSGQTGQTVNLLALRLRWFESSPAQFFPIDVWMANHLLTPGDIKQRTPLAGLSGLFAGHRRADHHRTRRHLHSRPRRNRVRRRPVAAPLAGVPRLQLMGDPQRSGR